MSCPAISSGYARSVIGRAAASVVSPSAWTATGLTREGGLASGTLTGCPGRTGSITFGIVLAACGSSIRTVSWSSSNSTTGGVRSAGERRKRRRSRGAGWPSTTATLAFVGCSVITAMRGLATFETIRSSSCALSNIWRRIPRYPVCSLLRARSQVR
ncbi:hypothetical protein STPH1_7672 [Streptomyces sp. OM5714]|nr:hypothetical protein STPH1_7672 [Streptomyces sp. OM5714]